MLRLAIIALTLATAGIHLSLNFPDPVFILNGLGYLGLLGALYLPVRRLRPHRHRVRVVFIGYTALTILLWVAIGARTGLAYADKLIEVALIALLVIEGRRRR
jgi:hypothetical protein